MSSEGMLDILEVVECSITLDAHIFELRRIWDQIQALGLQALYEYKKDRLYSKETMLL